VISITVSQLTIWEVDRVGTKGTAVRHSRNKILSIRILWLLGVLAATPAGAATFDGEWNVRIASRNNACTSGATVQIGINNGKVASANGAVAASGHVADDGDINVTVTNGMKQAVGSGRLTATSGSGTWRGTMCAGTWTAQRI
jgi:hypothetical protein